MNRCHDLGGIESVLENDSCAEQRRKKNSEELTEDVAERQQVEKAQRMKEAFVLEILRNLGGDGSEIAGHVGVGENDSLGLGGGAGGEDDFQRDRRVELRLGESDPRNGGRWRRRDRRDRVVAIPACSKSGARSRGHRTSLVRTCWLMRRAKSGLEASSTGTAMHS